MVMLAQLRENQAERKIGRILMETIKQMTYTLRIFISKRKKKSIFHFKKWTKGR